MDASEEGIHIDGNLHGGRHRRRMIRTTRRLIVSGLLLAVASAACGGGGTATDERGASPSSPPSATGSATSAAASGDAAGSGKDACAALPRSTIRQVVGSDPGEGELETVSGIVGEATICRYYGDAQVTVEIDAGSGVADARASIEAYGDTCESIGDIGDEALFCTGGFKAQGFTGQIVWTDGQRTYFVVYNFGDATPSKDVTLDLARRLEP
ncbi:MAG: hypothetical protein C0498_14120 [Anaerolinea sp.]|nr:hypothetical protein [Anaerolinea sp.]